MSGLGVSFDTRPRHCAVSGAPHSSVGRLRESLSSAFRCSTDLAPVPHLLCMPDITLYGPIEAPFTAKVRGALALKKLEYTHRTPESPEDYKRWSPKTGLLPVIEIDGEWTEDSSKILDLLDERFPDPPLLAPETKIASSQRRLEEWAEATFIFYWVNYLRSLVEQGDLPPHQRADDAATKRQRDQLGEEFPQRLDDLVNFLGSRPYFYADQPSRADLAVFSFLWNMAEAVTEEVAEEVESRPTLRDYVARMSKLLGFER